MRKVLAMLIVGGLVAGLVSAGFAAEAAKPKVKIYKEWDFTKSGVVDEWAEVMKNNLEAQDSAKSLKLETTGPDPYIFFPEAGFAAEEFPFIVIKMKGSKASAEMTHQIYFATEDMPDLGEDKVVIVKIKKDQALFNIDMKKCKNWTGNLTVLRLEPFSGVEEVGNITEIESIKIASGPIE